MKKLTRAEIIAFICGLRQLQNYGYPYAVDEKLSDEEIDSLCENLNFEVVIEGYIAFTTIEEGYSILMNEYAKSEVVGGEMIDHMIKNRVFNPSIPEHVLDGAIKMFREWDSKEDNTSRYPLWEKNLKTILEYAEVGDYLGCLRDDDLWQEVLSDHTDIYPYEHSFDEYDSEWFEQNNMPFVEFIKQVIEKENQ